ncbi:MAG: holo-ACP synthase [Bacilli bacterium]
MIGIDLVEIKRITLTDKFIAHVLSPQEIEVFSARKDQMQFIAGRFAAKEAFLKAQQKGLFSIPLNQIEVLNNSDGSPYIVCRGTRYENVSISHERDYAVAVVEI